MGAGIHCVDCSMLKIYDSSFQNLKSIEGGAIYAKQILKENDPSIDFYVIQNSLFKNNSAHHGGAIMLSEP